MKGGQSSILNNQQWAKLEKGSDPRHKLIWAFLRFTGARIQEVLLLKVEDVYLNAEKREIRTHVYYRKNNRKGKDKSLTVPINSTLKSYLESYSPPATGWLFPSPRNSDRTMSYEAAYKYLKARAELAGLGHLKISTHCGRRTCLTNLAAKGIGLRTIQKISGHSSLANLQKYIEVTDEQIANAVEVIA